MNKDLIKANKAEFDWWLDGRSILQKSTDFEDWFLMKETEAFNSHTSLYVINDKYSEFRKALAEGKTVEILDKHVYKGNNGKYFVKGFTDNFNHPVEAYRIKPDKQKFEVGDYVVNEEGKIDYIVNIDHNQNVTLRYDKGDYWQWKYFIGRYKLWTLEEASDDEWVVVGYNSGLIELCTVMEANKTKRKYHANQQEQKILWIKPYIQQSIEELGL